MRLEKFITDNFYHIYNRGVDKRKIFLDDADCHRFVASLYEFNTAYDLDHFSRKLTGRLRESTKSENEKAREPIVDICCFSLVSNHFHLLLRQRVDGGIERFMRRLGIGYAKYFNKRYERSGALFESRFKAKFIKTEQYLLYLSGYIHLNPLDILIQTKSEQEIKLKQAAHFLESYRWSSFRDYIGRSNFGLVIERQYLNGYFQSPQEYKELVYSRINSSFPLTIEDYLI